MFHTTNAYNIAKNSGKKPVLLAYLTGKKARRVFGKLTPTESETGTNTITLWDGTTVTGDGGYFDGGGSPIFAREARVVSFGSIEKTLTPERGNLIASLNKSELSAFSVTLDNTDDYFSEILGDDRNESFLTQELSIGQAFLGLHAKDFQTLTSGSVVELRLTEKTLTLMCEPTILSSNTVVVSKEEVSIIDGVEFELKWGSKGSGDGQFDDLRGIYLDSDDNVFIVDSKNHRIQKFDKNGSYISKFGTFGTGNKEFNIPYDIVIDKSDNIYVTDSLNNRVQKFDSNFSYISQFGSYGTLEGRFQEPRGIALDSSGNIFVVDRLNYRVQKFDSSGAYISSFGTFGTGDGQFKHSYYICVDTSDNVFVGDASQNQRVQAFTNDGIFLYKFGDSSFMIPRGLRLGPLGYLFVVSSFPFNNVQFFSGTTIKGTFGSTGSGDDEFSNPRGIAFNSTFTSLYITDTFYNRVKKFKVNIT